VTFVGNDDGVLPDGCADDPVAEPGNLTPFQAAKLPKTWTPAASI
jgi:2,3-bisphosphoglycerate-independent phosphoglycerate mutase